MEELCSFGNEIKPVLFTKEQMEQCKICPHVSGHKVWCCHFGMYIMEGVRGALVKKKPKNLIRDTLKYPPAGEMLKSFGRAAGKHIKSGLKTRTDVEQKRLMDICLTSGPGGKKCEHFEPVTPLGPRCKKCGCCLNIKKRWATAHCPIKKW